VNDRAKAVNGVLWLGTQVLGVGLVLFSAPAVFAPKLFGRMAGLSVAEDAAGSVAVRSVAIRDVVMGAAMVSAARQHQRLAPWFLIRTFCDGGDAVGIALAFLRGAGNTRLGMLGAIALGATIYDLVFYTVARREEG
jgi:hypothetical protein